jgi:hypothetical protein
MEQAREDLAACTVEGLAGLQVVPAAVDGAQAMGQERAADAGVAIGLIPGLHVQLLVERREL